MSTVYQEAHKKIDQFPEETVYLIVQLMNQMNTGSETNKSRSHGKSKFLDTAGKIDIDENAVTYLREVSEI